VFIEFQFICLSKSFVHAGFIIQVCCSVRLYSFTALYTVAGSIAAALNKFLFVDDDVALRRTLPGRDSFA
jgi:hypothetical protein